MNRTGRGSSAALRRRTAAVLALAGLCGSLSAVTTSDAIGAAPSPVRAFDFNEGSGSSVNGVGSGLVADGPAGLPNSTSPHVGTPTWSTDTPSGTGTSLVLDGLNEYIHLNDDFGYGGDEVTVEMWVKPDVVGGNRHIVFDDYGSPGVFMDIGEDGSVRGYVSTTTHPGLGIGAVGGIVTAGTWQHIAMVYDGSTIRVFRNGSEVGRTTTSGTILEQPPSLGIPPYLTIGHEQGAYHPSFAGQPTGFDGKIDDFRVYRDALSPAELAGGRFAPTGFRLLTTSLPHGRLGQPYSATVSAGGGASVLKWKKVGKLPKGLKLDKITGTIAGTPRKSTGTFAFTVEAAYKTKVKGQKAVKHLASRAFTITVT